MLMKTKIIYISGGEVFEMAQVRAAFEEVRNTLGLDKSTVLFGVPVDEDSAFETENKTISNTESPIINTENVIDDASEPTKPVVTEQKVKKVSKKTKIIAEKNEPDIIPDITADVAQGIDSEPDINSDDNTDTIIPILSILGGQDSEPATETDDNQEPVTDDTVDVTDAGQEQEDVIPDEQPVAIEIQQTTITNSPDDSVVISDIKLDAEILAPALNEGDEVRATTIADMIDDDAPVSDAERTIEQLLESMTPLREDFTDFATSGQDSTDEEVNNTDDEDATLALLASEFAQKKDDIVVDNKHESYGKIGKLKNILPFKKAKQEDNNLMGDLFGWAGFAANDEDFSMPGFFTPNASRKQGA